MELEDSLYMKQDDRPILKTPLFDRLCSDDHWMNLRNSKDATVSMIVMPLRPYIGRLVYGSLIYPEMYHRNNLTTDIHHFLRQLFQRCKPLSWKDSQLKRLFFEEIKDGEGAHCHFFMETPSEMSVPNFIELCETRWRGIATRNRRHAMQMKRLKQTPKLSPLQPKTFLIKKGKPCVGQVASILDVDYAKLAGNPEQERLAQVIPIESLDDLTWYSLKWMTSNNPRFSSDLMTGGSRPSIRGHSTELVLL